MKKINWKYQPDKDKADTNSAPAIMFEKRVLTFVTISVMIGYILWLIGVSTDYWLVTIYYNHTELLWSHSGVWKNCSIFKNEEFSNCEYLATEDFVVVALILLLMTLSCGFSIYSL